MLGHALALCDPYRAQIAHCDAQLERQFSARKPRWESSAERVPLKPTKSRPKSKNQPAFHARDHRDRVLGLDLTGVMGFSSALVLTLLSESGTDLGPWPTVKPFAAWRGLAPKKEISGGKGLRSPTSKHTTRATQAFRQAAQSGARSDSALGAFYRRLRAKLGPEPAIVATAHKSARVAYHLLKYHEPFEETSAAEYDRQYREREIKYLQRKATKLGFTLTPRSALAPAAG